jgi:hypothetical protein
VEECSGWRSACALTRHTSASQRALRGPLPEAFRAPAGAYCGRGSRAARLYAGACMQGTVNTLSDLRKATSAFERVRALLNSTRAEPQVEAAVPPGEWWLHTQQRAPRTAAAAAPAAARNGAGAAPSAAGTTASRPLPPLPHAGLEPWLPQDLEQVQVRAAHAHRVQCVQSTHGTQK